MFGRRFLFAAFVPVLVLALEPQSEKSQVPDFPNPPATQEGAAAPAARPPLTPETRGDIFMARKMYREAIDQYRQAPETAIILNKIGIAYHQTLDLRAAQRYYERSIKRDSKYSEAVNNLGAVFYARKNYGRALRQYEKALKLNPNSASIYSNLGTAHFSRKEYKEAFAAYQQAIKLDPDVFEHHSSYGVLLQESTIEERARFHYYLAKMYAQAGMVDQAVQCVRKAMEEGFKERNKFIEEPEFAGLKDNADFKALMSQEPRVL
jgi:tetratricopeptide (TPR) repeat protein